MSNNGLELEMKIFVIFSHSDNFAYYKNSIDNHFNDIWWTSYIIDLDTEHYNYVKQLLYRATLLTC